MNIENPVISFIDSHFAGKANVRFIQVGTNDAVNADFLRPRVLAYGWSGILIEPHPTYFDMAKVAYGSCNKISFENIAISDVESESVLYYVSDVPEAKRHLIGIASFDREHLTRHGIESSNIGSVNVPTIRLDKIIKKYLFYHVDLLIVDVEGHELNVFKSIDFSQINPKIICLETAHLSSDKLDQILELCPKNYRLVKFPGEMDSIIFSIG